MEIIVNDVHSRLNETVMRGLLTPSDVGEIRGALRHAADRGLPVSVMGGRHAMGGQQFCVGGLLLDMDRMRRASRLDPIVALRAGG